MSNKEFKEEAAGISALFIGTITVLTLCSLGNPNALGENLFWMLFVAVFSLTAAISGGIIYGTLTLWEKRAPRSFTEMKRKIIIKTNRFTQKMVED